MKIGNREVGSGSPVLVVAEIGINHNGDLDLAEKLILAAKESGCDAVKFQKRTIDAVYSAEELSQPRQSPFGSTNGDLKRALEFSFDSYSRINKICRDLNILWFASPWDIDSVSFLEQFDVPCHKVAAASLTDSQLLKRINDTAKPVMLSTGMSTLEEIDKAVKFLDRSRLILMHCVSEYPANPGNINLRAMDTLARLYGVPTGYSGHELDTTISLAAVGMGACVVERHLTLDRNLWGSDHKASLIPDEMSRLVSSIRLVESALGDPIPRCLSVELPIKEKLRRVDSI